MIQPAPGDTRKVKVLSLPETINSRRRAFARNVDFSFIVSGSERTFTFRVSVENNASNYHLHVESDQRDNQELETSLEIVKQELTQAKEKLNEREKKINELEAKLSAQLSKQHEVEEQNRKEMNDKLSASEVSKR